jgi:hypothetical protein
MQIQYMYKWKMTVKTVHKREKWGFRTIQKSVKDGSLELVRVILEGTKYPYRRVTLLICTGKSSRIRGHFLPIFRLENREKLPGFMAYSLMICICFQFFKELIGLEVV